MVVSAGSLDLTEYADVLNAAYGKASAFAQATPPKNMGVGVKTSVHTLSGFAPSWTAEGATKSAGGGATKIEIKTEKLAHIHIFTEEADISLPALTQSVEVDAPGRFAEVYDRTVAGEVASPSALFHTLSGATEVEVSGWADLNNAVGGLGRGATAFVLSERLYRRFTGMTTTTGAPILNTETKTLLGLPVYTFVGQTEVGYVGDFRGSAVHSVAVSPTVRRAVDGIVVDGDSVEHNLTQENKVAYIVEGYYAFGVRDVAANFAKLTFVDAGEETEA